MPWTRNERSAVAGLKTTSYAENVVALAYAKERGGIEAIFANTRGELCEGTGTNVFVVVDGELLHAAAGLGLPRRHHPRADARVVPRRGACRCASRRCRCRCSRRPTRCSSPARTKDVLADLRRRRPALPAPGPVTARAAEVFARSARERIDP